MKKKEKNLNKKEFLLLSQCSSPTQIWHKLNLYQNNNLFLSMKTDQYKNMLCN